MYKRLPVVIIDRLLSHHFSSSKLDITRTSRNQSHALYQKVTQFCKGTDDTGNCTIMQGWSKLNNFIPELMHEMKLWWAQPNLNIGIKVLIKCYKQQHVVVLI